MVELHSLAIRHVEHISENQLLYVAVVDPTAAATELDAVDDQVVVRADGGRGIRLQGVDVSCRFGGGEGMVRGRESGRAALSRFFVAGGLEEREVGYPEEVEALRWIHHVQGKGCLVER
jgi:hypothetical protein